MISEVTCEDCMIMMARYPDKFFDLAIVDPPYGIGYAMESKSMVSAKGGFNWVNAKGNDYEKKDWDDEPPTPEYFTQLFRVSKRQIVWGGNYFELPSSGGWVLWDKKRPEDFSLSQGELAWVSFTNSIRIFRYRWSGMLQEKNGDQKEQKLQPAQKPIALYSWLLKNYATCNKCNNIGKISESLEPQFGTKIIDCDYCDVAQYGIPKILDTHLGSGSSRIAAYKLGFDFWATELDKDYFEAAEERFKKAIHEPLFQTQPEMKQNKIFD